MREKFLLWFAALAAFGGCVFAAFEFDDFSLFSKSPVMLPAEWIDCFRQTRPLTELTFWLNDALFGRSPISWHVVDLLLHLAVVALVWDVLRKLIGDRAGLIAAAIFAVHPMMTEPVAYVFARATLLATLFSLLAIRAGSRNDFGSPAFWFTVAMLAKEECAALPLVLMLLPRRRTATTRRCTRSWQCSSSLWQSASARSTPPPRFKAPAWAQMPASLRSPILASQGVVDLAILAALRNPVGIFHRSLAHLPGTYGSRSSPGSRSRPFA